MNDTKPNLVVRLDSAEDKQLFHTEAKEICGDASTLIRAFVRSVILRRRSKEEVWRFCFDADNSSALPAPAAAKPASKQPILPTANQRNKLVLNTDETEKLLAGLGDWIVPQGTEYFLAGTVHAGPWRDTSEANGECGEWTTDIDLLNWNKGRDLMLRLTANCEDAQCLTGDGIFPGDKIHFRCDLIPEEGDIVLAVGADQSGRAFATVKHYHEIGDGVLELRPSNPNCPTITVNSDDVEIHGVMYNLISTDWRKHQRARQESVSKPVPVTRAKSTPLAK